MLQQTNKIPGIYKIISPKGRIYIGQSNNVHLRIKRYKSSGSKSQPRLNNSFLKYGIDNHLFLIIEGCSVDLLNERERYWQEFYDVTNGGLNCSLVNTKNKKYEHSLLSAKKISDSRTGIKFTKEHCENIRRVRTGTKSTKETKLKLSLINKGKIPPSWKGRIKTKEHMANISKALTGRVKTKEENKKTSDSMLSKPLPYSDILIDLNTGVFYYSIRDAARVFGMNASVLRKKLKISKISSINKTGLRLC